MKSLLLFALAAGAVCAADDPIARSFDRNIGGVESEVVSLAEAMPANVYNFAPRAETGKFEGVRTFAQQAKHIAAVNYLIAGAVLGSKPPVDTGGESGPDSIKTKEQIVEFLKGSFAYLHSAMQSLTAEKAVEMTRSPFGSNQSTRIAIALEAASHCFDHYGQMVVYARMNGIVPPASR